MLIQTHQFGVELLRRAAAVHGHEGLRGRGHAAVVQVEGALPFGAQTVLRAAGEQRSLLGVNLLEAGHRQSLADGLSGEPRRGWRRRWWLTSSSELLRLPVSSFSR